MSSEPFTDISQWEHLQDRTAANEILLAYSERRQCVGDSAVSLLGAGNNAQDTAFWRGMQQWVTQQAQRTSGNNRWLDYTQAIEGEYSIPFYTLSSFKSNSDLTGGASGVVGFRRAIEWPSDWTDYNDPAYVSAGYGPIQSGDIRGPWIFEDLHKAFDALRWTHSTQTSLEDDQEIVIILTDRDSESELLSDLRSEWDSADWSAGGVSFYDAFFNIDATIEENPKYSGTAIRSRGKYKLINIPDHISHSVSLFHFVADYVSRFNDVDGLSPDAFALAENMESETTTERLSGYLPYDSFPEPSSYIVNEGDYWASSIFENACFVLKWQFSHTL
jgi:hypothetical protein